MGHPVGDRHATSSAPPMDWTVPKPRTGWRGAVDRFFGPGQTRGEIVVHLVLMPIVLGALAWVSAPALRTLDGWSVLVLAVFAVDAVGGVVTNSTGSAKRWYHRPGTRDERLRFVALHVVHLALLAGLVLEGDWTWFTVNVVLLAATTIAVELTPISVRRPTAMALLILVLAVNAALVPLPAALGWVPLLLYVKLLLAHLVPEAPFRDSRPA